jgi:hypothetical protein
MAEGLCTSCQSIKPVADTDVVGREYCEDCVKIVQAAPMPINLLILAVTQPFHVGDRVECRTAGVVYDGIGVIDEVSTDWEKWGTPVYPSFHVVLEEKAYPECPDAIWYQEMQLRKVDA